MNEFYNKVLEENVKEMTGLFYDSLKRISELNAEMSRLNEIKEVSDRFVSEVAQTNIEAMIQNHKNVAEHLERMKKLLGK